MIKRFFYLIYKWFIGTTTLALFAVLCLPLVLTQDQQKVFLRWFGPWFNRAFPGLENFYPSSGIWDAVVACAGLYAALMIVFVLPASFIFRGMNKAEMEKKEYNQGAWRKKYTGGFPTAGAVVAAILAYGITKSFWFPLPAAIGGFFLVRKYVCRSFLEPAEKFLRILEELGCEVKGDPSIGAAVPMTAVGTYSGLRFHIVKAPLAQLYGANQQGSINYDPTYLLFIQVECPNKNIVQPASGTMIKSAPCSVSDQPFDPKNTKHRYIFNDEERSIIDKITEWMPLVWINLLPATNTIWIPPTTLRIVTPLNNQFRITGNKSPFEGSGVITAIKAPVDTPDWNRIPEMLDLLVTLSKNLASADLTKNHQSARIKKRFKDKS